MLQDGAAACGDDAAMATYSSSPTTEAPTMERDGFVLARLDEVVQAARTDSLWFRIFGLTAPQQPVRIVARLLGVGLQRCGGLFEQGARLAAEMRLVGVAMAQRGI